MLSFGDISQKDCNNIGFNVYGDGQSTTLKINIKAYPFLMNFEGCVPAIFEEAKGLCEVTYDDLSGILTLTFSEPPKADVEFQVNIGLGFNSL